MVEVAVKSVVLGFALTAASAVPALAADGQAVIASRDAVRLIRALEQEPLSPDAAMIRSDLIDWVAATKDVTITVCDVLGPVPGTQVPYGAELFVQAMFGKGAFQLEHPEHKGNEQKAQLAGIESMLRSYERIVAMDPYSRIAEYDEWLSDLEAGRLEAKVGPNIQRHCLERPSEA